MHHSDHEHGFRTVIPGFVHRSRDIMIMPVTLHFPMQPAQRSRYQVKAAPRSRIAGEKRSQNINAQDEQSKPHQPLSDAIDAMRQGELKHDDRTAQYSHSGGMSHSIKQTQPHALPAAG